MPFQIDSDARAGRKPLHFRVMSTDSVALVATTATGPGILHQLTGVIARHQGDISSVEILEGGRDASRIYLEISLPRAATSEQGEQSAESEKDALLAELRAMPIVRHVEEVQTFQRIYGKRIIIIGGGAQVGQV